MPLDIPRHAIGAAIALLLCPPAVPRALEAQQPTVPAPQPTGRIVGRVVDAESGLGLADVGVQVVGTTIGTMSGVDGRYLLPRVPAGTITLHVRRIGYTPKTITGIMLAPDGALEQNVSLSTATVKLAATVVTATAERGTVNEALDRQRTAASIVSSVTSEQIARSPDSDAAQAVQRVSGVTVQDGKYVFVRGLGERYTTASLNGTRIPSPEPDRKVVPLDLFPAGLIQSITTSKTFTPDQPGDFAGASVDIQTREFPARRQFAYSATVGANGAAMGRDVLTAPGVGGEMLALAGGARDIPVALRAAGSFRRSQPSESQRLGFLQSFRDTWRTESRSALPNGSWSASVGGNDPILGHGVGYLASGTWSMSQEVAVDQQRALAMRGSAGQAILQDPFTGSTGRTSAMWGGLLNLSTMAGTRSRLAFNGTYNRTADNEARLERGPLFDAGVPVEIQRMRYVERSIGSAQLTGTHQVADRHAVDWAATGSRVTRDEPDRTELVYQIDSVGGAERLLWFQSNGEGAVRTFGALRENAFESRANYRFSFGDTRQNSIRIGVLARNTNRVADNRSYGIESSVISDEQRALPPEELFSDAYVQQNAGLFRLRELGQGGSYDAADRLLAGYGMGEYALTGRFRLIGGARVERSVVKVNSENALGDSSRVGNTYTDLLPSLALNVKLTEAQSLRLSASRTLARPEYRELADITSRQVLAGEFIQGNPGLERTLIANADLRWEWFPNAGEVLGVGVFAKHFDSPIERVYQATSTNPVIEFVNADAAVNYGIELEARKGLGFLADALAPFSTFANVTVMKSEIRLGSSAAASTNADRAMLGQAPYVINTGLTWAPGEGRLSATALYNRVGERIVAAGESPLPDVVERPRDVLDLSLRFPVLGELSGRFDARNVLDARFLQEQGGIVREAYRTGRVFQLGLTWRH